MSQLNIAMIGLGFGAEFIPIYQAHPNANVAAICRRNEEELNRCGDQFGIDKRYTDYDDVLADPDIDYVHINSPIPDHAWMSLKALDAGNTEEVRRISHSCAGANATCGMNGLVAPMRELERMGNDGDISHGKAQLDQVRVEFDKVKAYLEQFRG